MTNWIPPHCVRPGCTDPITERNLCASHFEYYSEFGGNALELAAKSHCSQGHPYSPENTRLVTRRSGAHAGSQARACRICRKELERRRIGRPVFPEAKIDRLLQEIPEMLNQLTSRHQAQPLAVTDMIDDISLWQEIRRVRKQTDLTAAQYEEQKAQSSATPEPPEPPEPPETTEDDRHS